MFSYVYRGVDVYKVGIRQLRIMLDSRDGLFCDSDIEEEIRRGDFLSVSLASTFGEVEKHAFIDQRFRDPNKAAMHANVISGLGVRQALEVELWQVVGDKDLWEDWERKISPARFEMPRCYACDDDCGPWVRVPTPGGFGHWAYLCEQCFDRYNRINTLVGRYQLECY